jgi:hypothetical protein
MKLVPHIPKINEKCTALFSGEDGLVYIMGNGCQALFTKLKVVTHLILSVVGNIYFPYNFSTKYISIFYNFLLPYRCRVVCVSDNYCVNIEISLVVSQCILTELFYDD